MLKQKTLTKADARSLIIGCFHDLAAEADQGWIAKTTRPDLERDEQEFMSLESVIDLQFQREANDYGARVSANRLRTMPPNVVRQRRAVYC